MTISPAQGDWVLDTCTLPTAEQPIRIAEFDRFFAEFVHGTDRPSATKLNLHIAADAEPAGRDLAARESNCCSFFSFTFDTTATGLVMQVGVPAAYVEVLDAFAARVTAVSGTRS
ncbi:hypothetical protein [Nocardia stercoris]|uniref:Arsenate reductase n=1 Tax=Nocardia stercoris TaxID=2483361 RepID=A0A3M2KW81_9NOCA|nr:hypothetical protein [Nocardia stercoris]RMI28493.1 hypothetical protein EBN03_30225 [Nocardia stercoris]